MENYPVDTEKQVPVRRGDSFDIGQSLEPIHEAKLINLVQNPGQLAELLNITETQAHNIASVLTGTGAGLATKYLGKYFGNAVAGGFGGLLAGFITEKMLGKR